MEVDLGLDRALVKQDVEDYCHARDALQKLVSARRPDPGGGEPIRGLPTGYKSLHYGRSRGATQWVEDEDVCWLVACGDTHASGERRDVYNDFLRLHHRGELAPTVDDYEALEDDDVDASFIEQLRELGLSLLEEARARPGAEAMESLHRGAGKVSIVVDVVVFPAEGSIDQCWIGITVPSAMSWPAADVFEIALALTGNADLEWSDAVGRRGRHSGELAYSWVVYRGEED